MILALLAVAAQLGISVSAPESVAHEETAVVTVQVRSPSLIPPSVVPPLFPGFVLRNTTATTRVVVRDSTRHAVLELQYHLYTPLPGTYEIGAFSASINGRTVRSLPRRIVVRGPVQTALPAIVTRPALDSTRPVSVAALGTPDTVFVGEQATYEVGVFIDEAVLRQRAARNPTFTPPDLRGTLSYEIPPTRAAIPSRIAGGRRFRPHIYQRAIFPLVPGRHVVPAATLDYSLPISGAILSGKESHTLRADSVVIVALPLPLDRRPANFDGAVGLLRLEQSVTNTRPRVGDPFVVRARVSGTANIRLLPRPLLQISWADVLPAGERVYVEVSDARVGGHKEFDWVVTPREGGVRELPELAYPYFDPKLRQYRTAAAPAVSLEVLPGSLVAANEMPLPEVPPVSLRRRLTVARDVPLFRQPLFLAALALVPLPALIAGLRSVPRRKKWHGARTPRLEDIARDPAGVNLADVRRLFLSQVESRLSLKPGAASSSEAFKRALLHSGVSRETTSEAERLVHDLDALVFGVEAGKRSVTAANALDCYRRIDAEATTRTTGLRVIAPALLLVSLVQPEPSLQDRFDAGALLYDRQAYAEAAREFLDLSRTAPHSPEVWANLGAAAWQSADTAAAMVAWQRALRLDPTAQDIRANIGLVVDINAASAAGIPPFSSDALAVGALLLWSAGWLLAFRRVTKRATTALRMAGILCAASLAVGALAVHVAALQNDDNIAVVANTVMSQSLPALGSEQVSRLNVGEVVTAVDRQGEWTRVELNGEAAGWVHNSYLIGVSID